MSHDDALSLSMFWAGALMVFTPLITAAVVIAVLWRQRIRAARTGAPDTPAGGSPRSARTESAEA